MLATLHISFRTSKLFEQNQVLKLCSFWFHKKTLVSTDLKDAWCVYPKVLLHHSVQTELKPMTIIYIEWSQVLSCFTLDVILIPSHINSTYTLLCFHTSLVRCHIYWQKQCESVNTRNNSIYTMLMAITLEDLKLLKILEGKFRYVTSDAG